MDYIKNFLNSSGNGVAYEFNHAYTYFSTKSDNVRVFTNLFKRATSHLSKKDCKPGIKREKVLTGKSALNRYVIIPKTLPKHHEKPSQRVLALDLAGMPFRKDIKASTVTAKPSQPVLCDLEKRSALKKENPEVKITRDDFAMIFGKTPKNDRTKYKSYLRTLKSLTDQYYDSGILTDQVIEGFEKAIDQEKTFNHALVDAYGDADNEKACVLDESGRLCQSIQDLEVGESFIYFGKVVTQGAPNLHPYIMKLLKEQVPGSVFKFLFEDGEEELVQEIKTCIQSRVTEFKDLKGTESAEKVKNIATQVAQITQNTLQNILPEWWYDQLVENTKDDILEIILGKNRSDETAQYAERVWKRMQEKGIEKALELEVMNVLESSKEAIYGSIRSMTGSLTQNLPKTLMHCIEIAGFSSDHGGDYWLEIIKKKDGKVSVRMISNHTDSTKKQGDQTGSQLPLVFDDVGIEDINHDFFTRLVTFQAWPYWKRGVSYSMNHLKDMLIQTLGTPEETFFPSDIPVYETLQDWIKLFIYHKFDEKQDVPDLFDYVLPFETLTNLWAEVIKDKELIKQSSFRAELRSACDHLTEKGLRLYENKKIDFDELRVLHATVFEVKEALEAEEKTNAEPIDLQSKVVPPKVQLYIKTLLESTGSSAKSIDMVRDLCLAVFGDEFGCQFDQIMDEILPEYEKREANFELTSFSSEVGFFGDMIPSLEEIKRVPFSALSAVRVLGKILSLIRIYWLLSEKVKFTAAALTRLVPQLANTRLGAKGVALVIVLFGPDVAKKYIPTTLFNTVMAVFGLVTEVYGYIFWRVGMILLKVAVRSLVEEKDLQSLTKRAESVHGELTQKGKVTFDALVEPVPIQDPVTIELSDLTIPRVEERRNRRLIWGAVRFDPPRPDEITSENVIEKLDSWVQRIQSNFPNKIIKSPLYRHFMETFINEKLQCLPIPIRGKEDIWDQIESPELAMDLLHKLLLNQHRCAKWNSRQARFQYLERITTTFTLYAIIDKLARRCEVARIPDEYLPNGVALIPYMGDPVLRVLQTETRLRFNLISDYFGINPKKKYDKDDIYKYQLGRLFHFEKICRSIPNPNRVNDYEFRQSSLATQSRDGSYLYSLLEDKQFQEDLKTRDISVDELHPYHIMAHLFFDDPHHLVPQLEEVSAKVDKYQRILPKGYRYLRLCHLMANQMISPIESSQSMNAGDPDGFYFSGDKSVKGEPWPFLQYIKERLDRRVLPYYYPREISANLPLLPSLNNRFNPGYDCYPGWSVGCNFTLFESVPDVKLPNRFEIMTPMRSQSEVMIEGPGPKWADTDPKKRPFRRQLELLKIDSSDQIVRCMSLFTDMKKSLSMYGFLWLLDYIINDPIAISQQLSDNRRITEDFGRYFTDTLTYLQKAEDWTPYLCLINIGREFLSHCVKYNRHAVSHFPDFRELIRSEACEYYRIRATDQRQLQKAKDGLVVSLMYLVSSYYDCYDGGDQEQMFFDIARLAYSRSSWVGTDLGSGFSEIIKCKTVVYRWGQQLKEKMICSSEFRNRVLDQLVLDIGLSNHTDGEWVGTYPCFSKGELTFNLEELEAGQDRSVIEDIESTISVSLGVELKEGIYTSQFIEYPHLDIRVKIIDSINYQIFKTIDGKVYRLIQAHQMRPQPKDLEPEDVFWLEQNAEKSCLLQLREGKQFARHFMTVRQEENRQVYQLINTEFWRDDQYIQEARSDRTASGLSLLNWFQPLSNIKTYTSGAGKSGRITHIDMTEVNLSFTVQDVDGKKRAMCKSAGLEVFYISSRQNDSHLFKYSRYLLLKNEKKERKVLLPRLSPKQLVGEFLFKNFANLSSSPYIDNMLSQKLDDFEESKIFNYSMDAKGRLASTDPEALAYLILHDLCKGDVKNSLRHLTQLEDLGRQAAYPTEVLDLFDQLLIPLSLSQERVAEKMLLRLAAIRESNLLIHGDEAPDECVFDLFRWLTVQKKYHDYLKARKLGKETYLSPYDELFILKSIGKTSHDAFEKRFGDILKKSPISLDGYVENLVMMPLLAQRYNDLRIQFNDGSSWQRKLHRSLLEMSFGEQSSSLNLDFLPTDPIGAVIGKLGVSSLQDNRMLFERILDDFRKNAEHSFKTFEKGLRGHANMPEPELSLENLSLELCDLKPRYIYQNFFLFYRLALDKLPSEWVGDPDKEIQFAEMVKDFKRKMPLLKGKTVHHRSYIETLHVLSGLESFNEFIDPDLLEKLFSYLIQHCELKEKLGGIMTGLEVGDFDHSFMIPEVECPREFLFDVTYWHLINEELKELEEEFKCFIQNWIADNDGYFFNKKAKFLEVFKQIDNPVDRMGTGKADPAFNRFQRHRKIASSLMKAMLKRFHSIHREHYEKVIRLTKVLSDSNAWSKVQKSGYPDALILGDKEALKTTDDPIKSERVAKTFEQLHKISTGELHCSEFGFRKLVDSASEFLKVAPYAIFNATVDEIIQTCADKTPCLSAKRIVAKQLAQSALGSGASSVVGLAKGVANRMLSEATYLGTVRRSLTTLKYGVWTGTKVFNAASGVMQAEKAAELERSEREEGAVVDTKKPLNQESLSAIIHREEGLNKVLDEIVDQYLEVDVEAAEIEKHSFEAPLGEEIRETFQKMQQSLVDYYRRDGESKTIYRLKEGQKLNQLKKDLMQLRAEVSKQLKKSRKNINDFVNTDRQKIESEEEALLNHFAKITIERKDLSFKEIDNAFIEERDDILTDQLRLPDALLPVLKQKLYLYHVMASRFNLLFDQLEKLPGLPADKSLNLIGTELERKRVYDFEGLPERLLRGKIVFESRSKKLLREKQSKQIDLMLMDDEHSRLVVEMIMGSGKTWYGIPITDYCFTAINIWPAAVAKTNISYIGRQARKIFSQAANAFEFTRGYDWSKDRLWAILRTFQRAHEENQQINMTKESAQAIELCFLEQVIDIEEEFRNRGKHVWHERIDLFRNILLDMRERGKGNIDEAHKAFDNRKELNHPLGKFKRLDKEHVKLTEDVLYHLLSHPKLQKLLTIKTTKPSPLSKEDYRTKVMPILAAKLVSVLDHGVEKRHHVVLKHYFMGHTDRIPKFVLNSANRAKIDLVKGLLTIVLPGALEKTIHVDFNPSKEGNGEYARPSEGNDNPLEKSTIRSPYEAFVKTGLMLAHDRLTEDQLRKLVAELHVRAKAREKKEGCRFAETDEAKFFAKHCPGYHLDTFLEKDRKQVFKLLNQSDRVITLYLRYFMSKQIQYYAMNLSSNASNFGSMFSSFFSDTGTPYNTGCYPVGTHPIYDPGTDGESVDLLLDESKVIGIQVLQNEAPEKVLDEVMTTYFGDGEQNACAFIDRGAVFNGLSSDQVARRMLQESSSAIKGIAFYHNRELVVLERGADIPIPYHTSSLQPHERLSYFPQPQTYAADIPQEKGAVGIVSIGENMTFNELAQAIWRMRGLRRDGQKLLFVLTKRVQKIICPDGKVPTVQDILAFSARNEDQALAQDHFQADKQKMHNVIRSAVLDIALKAKKIKDVIRIISEFKDIFITNLEDDPTKLFGYVDKDVAPEEIFKALRKKYIERIRVSATFSSLEKNKIKGELEGIGHGAYNETVHIYSDGGNLVSGGLDDMNKQVHVEAKAELDVETEEEAEMDIDLDQDQDLDQAITDKNRRIKSQKYSPWPKRLDTTNLDWLKIQKAPTLSDYTGFCFSNLVDLAYTFNPPPIFSLRDALQRAGSGGAAAISRKISSAILSTNNVTYLAASNGCPIEPFGSHQIPIFEVLVIQEEGKQPKLLLLDQKEAAHWRGYLRSDFFDKDSTIKMGIVDITSQMIVSCGHEILTKEDLEGDTIQNALTQLKFLRGDVDYDEQQREFLMKWLVSQRSEMESYFKNVHSHHRLKNYEGSVLHEVMIELEDQTQDHFIRG